MGSEQTAAIRSEPWRRLKAKPSRNDCTNVSRDTKKRCLFWQWSRPSPCGTGRATRTWVRQGSQAAAFGGVKPYESGVVNTLLFFGTHGGTFDVSSLLSGIVPHWCRLPAAYHRCECNDTVPALTRCGLPQQCPPGLGSTRTHRRSQ